MPDLVIYWVAVLFKEIKTCRSVQDKLPHLPGLGLFPLGLLNLMPFFFSLRAGKR